MFVTKVITIPLQLLLNYCKLSQNSPFGRGNKDIVVVAIATSKIHMWNYKLTLKFRAKIKE